MFYSAQELVASSLLKGVITLRASRPIQREIVVVLQLVDICCPITDIEVYAALYCKVDGPCASGTVKHWGIRVCVVSKPSRPQGFRAITRYIGVKSCVMHSVRKYFDHASVDSPLSGRP